VWTRHFELFKVKLFVTCTSGSNATVLVAKAAPVAVVLLLLVVVVVFCGSTTGRHKRTR